jgi:hypothetical protein
VADDRHTKEQLNVRVSEDAHKALAALQKLHGLSQAGVIEMLLRREARKEGILKPVAK